MFFQSTSDPADSSSEPLCAYSTYVERSETASEEEAEADDELDEQDYEVSLVHGCSLSCSQSAIIQLALDSGASARSVATIIHQATHVGGSPFTCNSPAVDTPQLAGVAGPQLTGSPSPGPGPPDSCALRPPTTPFPIGSLEYHVRELERLLSLS